MIQAERLQIALPGGGNVSGLLQVPPSAHACFILAHGAGAGMTHSFMEAISSELALRGIATLRFQFPFMEQGSKRPDRPAVAHDTIRAAVETATKQLPGMPLIAGGRSFGGRMTSQAQAEVALTGVRALVFIGFPLHPSKRPSTERALHLQNVFVPMLFIQGTRDELAELSLLRGVCQQLANRVTLHIIEDADHSFHVRVSSGRTDAEARAEIADAVALWSRHVT